MSDIEVARATVTIVPTMEGAQQSITEAFSGSGVSSATESAGKSVGSMFSSGLSKGVAVAGAATAAVSAVAVKAVDSFTDAASSVASYGDNIDKMSQKMGISREGYQEWEFIMQHCGTSMETLKSSMKTMANAAETGSDAFTTLGISQEQIASMSQEDLFSATISALQQVDDETQRTYLAGQVLGRGATELGALLNTSAEDTQAMKDQIHALGGVMSDDAILAAAGFEDALLNMQTATDGLKNNLMAQFLPGMNDVMNGMAAVFSGDSEGMVQVREGIMSIASKAKEVLPEFLSMGGEIIMSILDGLAPMLPDLISTVLSGLGEMLTALTNQLPDLIPVVVNGVGIICQSILDNLPAIIDSALQILMEIVNKLSDPDAIDKLIDTAINIIETLCNGLINALPVLIPAIIQIIVKLVTGLIERLPEIIACAVKLIGALVKGLIGALPDIAAGAGQIIATLLGELAKAPAKLVKEAVDWGKDLIDGFVKGVKDTIGKVGDAIGSVAETVASFIHFSEPDVGPLSDFHTYAPDMIDLFTSGLVEGKRKVSATMENILTLPENSVDATGFGGGTTTIPIYLGNELLDTVICKSNQRTALRSGGV